MGTKPTTTERERFDALVDCVLTVPKSEVEERISPERRLLDLQYLREELEAEEARKSQVVPVKSA